MSTTTYLHTLKSNQSTCKFMVITETADIGCLFLQERRGRNTEKEKKRKGQRFRTVDIKYIVLQKGGHVKTHRVVNLYMKMQFDSSMTVLGRMVDYVKQYIFLFSLPWAITSMHTKSMEKTNCNFFVPQCRALHTDPNGPACTSNEGFVKLVLGFLE